MMDQTLTQTPNQLTDVKCTAFRSGDGILIWTHKTMLEHLSEGFPGADLVFATDEAVCLTERSLVLRSLFERMHLRKHARLSKTFFSDGFELAEAAEKYLVYSVMASCAEYIERIASKRVYSMAAFRHGVKYDYTEVIDQAAPYIIDTHPNEIASRFRNHPAIVVAWTAYRNAFLEVAEFVTSEPPEWLSKKRHPHECEQWDPYFREVKRKLPRRATDCLRRLQGKDITWFQEALSANANLLADCPNGSCSKRVDAWKDRCETALWSIREFMSGCQIPVDLVLQSSDKVLIGAHKANLEAWSDGFPSANSVDDTHEPVDLTETAEILKLLMQGMHKTRFTPWATLSCDTVFALSEAAKKYFVYSVMAGCREYMYGWPDGQG
ncbi:hypothetical protein D9611_012600 [Ephemerocybe angulata]|uniref:BTB domain-containing protein n=1 Tax=Ephemerocybe angulata TaxID=980116 RepID=A0A8H5AWC1_9AGAR|nr:hypothetical protein D9611_012600 [Tulosesus angulatus]